MFYTYDVVLHRVRLLFVGYVATGQEGKATFVRCTAVLRVVVFCVDIVVYALLLVRVACAVLVVRYANRSHQVRMLTVVVCTHTS